MITYITKILPLALMFLICLSCHKTREFDEPAERDNILKLHHAQRAYHFNKNSIAFANQLSDNFISVNRGEISGPKRDETVKRYNSYFSSVEFLKWDDVSDPIIKFSDDGSMAYTIVDKIVVVTYKDETGNTIEGKTHFAWTTIYKKYGDEWKIDCVTSTEKPND